MTTLFRRAALAAIVAAGVGQAAAHARETGTPVRTAFGFSGLMRERIERGERADVFASADMGHPGRLLRDGRAARVVLFTRNALVVAPWRDASGKGGALPSAAGATPAVSRASGPSGRTPPSRG